MKAFYKVSFIVAGCLIAFGLMFGMVGVAFGGNRQLGDMAEKGELFFWNSTVDREDELEDLEESSGRKEADNGSSPVINDDGISSAKIKNLSIKVGAANLEVIPYDGSEYRVETNRPELFEYGAEDNDPDTFTFRSRDYEGHHNWSDHHNRRATLYVPMGIQYKNVSVKLGAGRVEMAGILCDDLSMKIGAGSFEAEELNVKQASIKAGAGSVVFSDCTFEKSDFQVNAGSIEFDGVLTGRTDVDCSVGSVQLDLEGEEEDFDYEVSASMADVMINGESISAMTGKRKIDNGSGKLLKIDCKMGGVDVDF